MDYVSAKEAAEKWRVNVRVVQSYCQSARIPGAKKYGASWMIPARAEKPLDPRKARKLPRKADASPLFWACADLPKDNPDAAPLGMAPAPRRLAAADIAFRRGDPAPAKAVWCKTSKDDPTKLSAASLATAAAISSGDYALYDEIQSYLSAAIQNARNERDKALLSLPGALAAVGMAAAAMTPGWLKACDFTLFPRELRPFLLYLYALHLRNIGAYAEMLGVAKAALMLTEKPATFTWLDVYLPVLCAVAASALGDAEQAKAHLDAALALALPSGFIAPLADCLGDLGGLLEAAVERDHPQYRKAVIDLWDRSFKNWIRFHNAFTKENITTVLSAREYQTARLIAHGATYADAARSLHLSVSRVKHVLADVYAKLLIQGKQDLPALIL